MAISYKPTTYTSTVFADVFPLDLFRNLSDTVTVKICFGKNLLTLHTLPKSIHRLRRSLVVLSTFVDAIVHVVVLCSKKEVVGIYASSIVAFMQYLKTVFNRSILKNPSLAMSSYSLVIKGGTSVPVIVDVSSMFNATYHVSAIISQRRVAP